MSLQQRSKWVRLKLSKARLVSWLRMTKLSVWFQINTNGFVATEEPTSESTYLGKMPPSFGMIAALQGDLDTSEGVGKVFFRQDSRPDILRRAAEHINRAFPSSDEVDPSHAVVVTWVDVASHTPQTRGDGIEKRVSFPQFSTPSGGESVIYVFSPVSSEKLLPAGSCIFAKSLICHSALCKRRYTVFLHPGERQWCYYACWLQWRFGTRVLVFQSGAILSHHDGWWVFSERPRRVSGW